CAPSPTPGWSGGTVTGWAGTSPAGRSPASATSSPPAGATSTTTRICAASTRRRVRWRRRSRSTSPAWPEPGPAGGARPRFYGGPMSTSWTRRRVAETHRPWQADADRYQSLEYRRVGRSGLLLPPISLGLWWNFGDNRTFDSRSEEHTSELQSRENLVCRLLLEKKK